MHRLELKIPPVALVILFAFAMWLVARMSPETGIQIAGREWVALVILIVGFALIIAGASAFISANRPLKNYLRCRCGVKNRLKMLIY